jgi:hypothetical protein
LYCPKCGDELKSSVHGLYCEKGEMYLSQFMEKRLLSCFITKIATPREFQLKYRSGANWYCPGCGIPIYEENGYNRCSKCHINLNEFVYRLIELHPHRNWPPSVVEEERIVLQKRNLSYLKTQWDFEDYSLKTWENSSTPEQGSRYCAMILYWPIIGHGETDIMATEDLKKKFLIFKEDHPSLPRPGTIVIRDGNFNKIITKYQDIEDEFLGQP